MKKINLLAGETSSGSSSTTISNLGLIQLKPLLDIEPTNEIQELYPGDDGVSGYSFIRINGVKNQDNKVIDPSVNEQVVTPDASFIGMKQVTVNAVTSTIDNNITADNIKHGVDILGVTGTYAPVTKPIEITPSTQEQVKVPDMGVDGFDSVTVHAVDKNIDSNIQAGNIRKGVEILGVTGEFGVELYDYDNMNFVKDTLVHSGSYANPIEIPVPEGYSGFRSVKLYSVGVLGLTVDPTTNKQTFSINPGDWYVGYNNVTVNPVTSSIDANIKPDNIIEGVSILGVEGKAGKFEMNISSATVHNTYSGNGEERPAEDRSSTLRYRYRIGFFDEYNNGCLANLLGIIYSVNDNRSNDVYLYAKDFSNHLALGTDKHWRSVYIYSDTPFNNIANLHVYFFYKDNKVPQFAFYGDQHIENYFLNNSYLLNLKDNNSIGQFTYGQIAQYPKPEFPESSLNGLNSWVNVYNKTAVPISSVGVQEVSNFNFGDTMYIQSDNSFIGNSTITGNYLDNSTLSPMAYKLVSNKDSKPTFLCNVNSGTGHICSFYTNNDKYTADISEYSTNVSLSYSETMSNKACTITNVDDIIVGSNVSVLSIKFGGDNYNPQRIFILRTSGFSTLTLEKDGDLSNTNIELVVPDSYSHNEVKSKLEEIGYTVTVNKLSTTDSSSQRYYFYTTNYGRHKFFMNDVPTDQWNYDLLIHTTGNSAPSFPGGVNEDGKQWLIFCNGNIDLKSCLYGFGYRTSYVSFSYHRYSADLFKKIGDFIYVDATTLGGVANSDGIFVTYDFNDHNIPEKFYFNCGNGDSISVGTSCKKCGVDAFNFDNNDYVITRKFFEYNVNYIPNGLQKTTIDNIINKDQVRTIKICNEDNVINNNYPMYTDFDGTKYFGSNCNIGEFNTNPAPRTGNNAENMYKSLGDRCTTVVHPDTTQCTNLRTMYMGSSNLSAIYNLHEDSFINALNLQYLFSGTKLDQRFLPTKLYFNKSCIMGSMFQNCPIKIFPEIIMESDTCNLGQLCEGFGGDTINSPHKKDGTLCKADNIDRAFIGYNLSTIGEFDFSLITSPTVSEKDRVLSNSEKLVNLGGFIGLQVDIDLSKAVNLTHESLMNVINKAATVTGKKMIFGATNLAKLTEAEKQIAIDKGWTLE